MLEIKGLLRLFQCQTLCFSFALCFRHVTEIRHGQCQAQRRSDGLEGTTFINYKGSAQRFMAPDNFVECLFESWDVEPSMQSDEDGDVVDGRIGLPLIEK